MILNPELFLSLNCPFCQERMLFRNISPFALHSRQKLEIVCGCGSVPLSLRAGTKNIYLDAFCPACLDEHSYIYPLEEVKNQLVIPSCQEVGINLAYLGNKQQVIENINQEGEAIISYQDEMRDLFSHPALMAKLLYHLNSLIAADQVSCCCGSHDFDLRVRANKLIVACAHCQASVYIMAADPLDLRLFKATDHILLDPQGPTINYHPSHNALRYK